MTKKSPTIELLYFDDCPSWKNALEILNNTLSKLGYPEEVSIIKVETHEKAIEHRFVGSPTIRVNGEDLYPIDQTQYALGCRVYQTPDGFSGWPTAEILEERLQTMATLT